MKTQQLAITLPSTTPKPRKEDVINAMVERASIKHNEEAKRLESLRETAEEKVKQAVLAEFEINRNSFEVEVCCYSSMELTFTAPTTPEIAKLKKAVNSIPTLRPFDAADVRRKIREGMNSSKSRVQALLDNPEAVKAMDEMLEQAI